MFSISSSFLNLWTSFFFKTLKRLGLSKQLIVSSHELRINNRIKSVKTLKVTKKACRRDQ